MTGNDAVDGLLIVAVVLGALTTIFTAFAKVPPLRALVRFLAGRIFGPAWRAVVVEPIKSWFHEELRQGVRPVIEHTVKDTVGKSIAQAVPAAVRQVVKSDVDPRLEEVRSEIVSRTERVRTELREHMVGEEKHRADEVEHRRELARTTVDMVNAVHDTNDRLVAVEERLGGVETEVGKPMRLSGAVERVEPDQES